jgi:hypothetical protein
MPVQRCGLKLATRAANVVALFDPPLATGEFVLLRLHIADPETGDPLFLLQEVKAAPTGGGTLADVTLPVQDISKGPLVGVSQEGAAKITLTRVEVSAGLTKKTLARFDLVVKTGDPYKSPLQEVQDGTPVSWFVTG